MKIRIATWNIASARKIRSTERWDYENREDLDYFADKIRQINPDVLCLQEAHINSHDSQANRLAEKLNMPFVAVTPGCPSNVDKSYNITIALLSGKQFKSQQYILFPHQKFELRRKGKVFPAYDRYMQLMRFDGFEVATMHTEPLGIFGLKYESGIGNSLAKVIDALLEKNLESPLIFAADFNMVNVNQALPLTMQKFRLEDALPSDQPTKPTGDYIDHIFISPEWKKLDSGVEKTESDHFLCWGEFELK